MIKEALQYIVGLSTPTVQEINGETYSDKPLHRVDYAPLADPIQLSTLESLVDYIKSEKDDLTHTGTRAMFIHVAAIYPVPHSWSKRRQAEAIDNQILPMVKPDWDNIGKIVCDALNGIAYKDDAAITDATVCKRYGTRPCVAVRLTGEEAPRDTV